MAPHSSTLAWKIPWTEEPGRLQSMGSLRVGQDLLTSLSLFTFLHWRRKWQPARCSCLENPRDRGAWWAAVYGAAQSQTRLKRLSSSSSRILISFDTEGKECEFSQESNSYKERTQHGNLTAGFSSRQITLKSFFIIQA